MKRYVNHVFCTPNNLLCASKKQIIFAAILVLSGLPFLLSAGSVYMDNLMGSSVCLHNTELENSISLRSKTNLIALANSVADITINGVTGTNPTNCIDVNGSINIDASLGNPLLTLEYSIDGGVTFQSSNLFENLTARTYSIVVRYSDGSCPTTASDLTLVEANEPVITNISSSNITDCDTDNGSFFIEATGDGALEFSIDGGATYTFSGFLSGLSAGTYSIVVRIAGTDCVSDTEMRTLTAPVAPTLTGATPTNLTSCSSNDGMISITASGGTNGNFEYSVDAGMSWQTSGNFTALGAGDYTPAVRNADDDTCPQIGNPISLTAPDAPEFAAPTVFNPSTCLGSDGVIEINVNNANIADLEFTIDNGITWQASNIFNNLPGGVYQLRIRTNDQTCFVSGPQVTLPGGVEPNIVDYFVQQITDCGADNGIITVIVDNDPGTFEYSADNGANYQVGNSFQGLSAGNYPIIVRRGDDSCPVTGQTVTINEPAPIVISNVNVNQPSDCDLADASLEITATGGSGSYRYSIDGGATFSTSNIFSPLAAGSYDIVVTNLDETCSVSSPSSVTISELVSPEIDAINAIPVTTCNSNDGSISVTASGGSGSYEYSIDNGLTWQSSNTFTGLSAGDYLLGVRNSDGSCPLLENAAQLLPTGTASIDDISTTDPTDCNVNDGVITITTSGPDIYEYSIDGVNFQQSNTFNTLAAGMYTVSVRNSDGTCTVTGGPVTLISDGGMITNVTSVNPSSCQTMDGSITVEATGTSIEYSIDGINYQPAGFFDNLPAGIYEVSIRNADDESCFFAGPEITLSAPGEPNVPTFFTENPTGCNISDGTITVLVSNDAGNFQYSIDGGQTFQAGNTFTGLSGGEYQIAVASNICTISGGSVSLLEPTEPEITEVQSQNPNNCESNDGFIVITGSGEGDLEYSIDGGLTWQFFGTFNGLDAGEYFPAIRNQLNGTCPVLGGMLVLNSADQPNVTSITENAPTDCNTSNGSIEISVTGGSGTYEYSLDGGQTFQASNLFDNLAVGTYNVIVRNADGTCSSDVMFTQLSSSDTPTVEAPLVNQPSDCGANDGIIVITAEGGTGSLEYSINGGQSWTMDNSFTGLTSGTYEVLVRNDNGTCPISAGTITLNSADSPIISSVFSQGTTDCSDVSDGLITVIATNDDGTFEYSIDGGNTFQNSNEFSGLAVGDYAVVVRKAGSTCLVNVETITISEPARPTFELSTSAPTCNTADGNINLQASGGLPAYEYTIDGGVTWGVGNNFDNLPAGSYTPGVRNSDSDCETIGDVIVLNSDDTPVFEGADFTNPTNTNNNDGTITITATACGSSTIEYSIDGGVTWQTGNMFTGLTSGTYDIFIRVLGSDENINGGQITLTAPVDEDCAEITDVQLVQPSESGAFDGSITIIIAGGIGTYSYSIDGGQTFSASNVFTGLGDGTYAIAIQNEADCQDTSAAVTLFGGTNGGGVTVAVQSTDPTDCEAADGTITITEPTGSNFTFSINGNDFNQSNTFNSLPAGTYNISVLNTDTNEETAFSANPVVLSSGNAVTITSDFANPSCSLSDGSISIVASNGNGSGLEYTINGGADWSAIANFTDLPAGAYNVAARNADGTCTSSFQDIDLQQTGTITINDVATQNIGCGSSTGSLTITASGGNGNLEYSIDGGTTWQANSSFANLSVGTYSIAVRNSDGTCETAGGTASIEMVTDLNITDIQVSNIGCDNTTGSITIVASGGDNLEFSIDNGANFSPFNTFNDLPVGTYTIVVRLNDGTCQTNGGEVSVTNEGGSIPTIEGVIKDDPSGCGTPDGMITVDVNNISNLEFSIDGGITYQASNIFAGLSAGTYNIFVRNNDGSCPVEYAINPVILENNTSGLFDSETITIQANEDGTPAKACVSAPIGELIAYDLILNGTPYNEPLTGCDEQAFFVYSYAELEANGDTGPYMINEWICNGGTFTGMVDNITDLVAQMNEWDPTGNWEIRNGQTIWGGEEGAAYSDIDITRINSQTGLFLMVNETSIPNGTCIFTGGPGEYELIAVNDLGCSDTLIIIVEGDDGGNTGGMEGDTIFLSTPINLPTEEICFEGLNLPSGEINSLGFCAAAANGGAPITNLEDNCITYFPNQGFLGQDEFCVVVCEAGGVICDTTIVVITVHPPTDIVNVEVETFGTEEVCLDDNILSLPGNITTSSICEINETDITVTIDEECVTFDPVDGTFGVTEVCVVHCDDSTPNSICDTTIFVVNVLPPCSPIFAESEITILEVEPTTEVCLPVSQLELIQNYNISINGTPYLDAPAPCDVDTVYNYPYSELPNDGLDGPLEIVEWICNGETFSFTVTDINDLLDSMQINDPAGNWTINETTQFISGGEQGAGYSDMVIDLPNGTDQVILDVSLTFIAGGGSVLLEGFGEYEIILTDEIGCMDTLNVDFQEDIDAQIIFLTTPFNTPIDEICADTSDLIGNFNPELGYCVTPMNGTSPIMPGSACTNYTPVTGFIGNDTLCVIACDDSPVAVCQQTTFIITVLPPVDTVEIVAPSNMEFDTCLSASTILQLPGELTSAALCGFNEDELAVSIQDTCLTIDLVDGFGLNSTEICVVHCDDSVPAICDTTIVIISGAIPCEDIIASTDTTLVTIDGNSNICISELTPTEVFMDYTVELDGELYDGPIGGCEFVDAFTYSYNILSDGPFPAVGWEVNGQTFSGSVENIQELVDSLNTWNPAGTWVLDEMNMNIIGQTATDMFGMLNIQDGIEIISLPGGMSQIPNGTIFVFEEAGGHTLIFTNNTSGCTDTINVNFLDEQFIINIETFQNENDTICFDLTDYPEFDSLSICGEPVNGTFEILDTEPNDSCFVFIPNQDFLGMDEGCIHVCSTIDGAVVCDEYTILINVIPDCPGDLIAEDMVSLMLDDCEADTTFCLNTGDIDLGNYVITDNGEAITPPDCPSAATGGYYDFTEAGSFPSGAYFVDSILINDVQFTGAFESGSFLIDSLNTWSATTSWSINDDLSRFVTTDATNTYDTLFISNSEGVQFQFPFVSTSATAGIELTLTAGIHQIIFTENITTCADTITYNVLCPDMEGCPELSAVSESEIITTDCETPVEYCISIPVDSLVNYTITDNGGAYTGGAVECSDSPGAAALQLLPGEHTLLFVRNDGSCMEEFFVDVRCITFEDTVIDTTINLGQPEIICLYEDLDIDTTGIISITNTCEPNTNDNVNFIIDTLTNCITLEPLNLGLDTACLEICVVDSCITLTINVEVLEQCDDLFALNNIGAGIAECEAEAGDICLPILLEDLAGTDIFIDGQLYAGERGVCDVDSIYSIGLATVPAAGQIGPYEVTFTITDFNGNETISVDTFDIIDEALGLLNAADPANPWVFQVFPPAFIGGSSLNNYTLGVVQLSTLESVVLGVDVFLDPRGTNITVPYGTSEIIFVDQASNCRDTLISTVVCTETEIFNVNIEVGLTDTLCFDTLDLPGNVVSIFNDCPELSGTEAEVNVIGVTPEANDSLCITYTGLTPGTETACIVICDDLGVCDTNLVIINVFTGDDALPVAVIDSTLTGQGQPVVFNPFVNDILNGILDTFYIVTDPINGDAAFSPDGTINYVPDAGYCDPATPDSLQYALCNTIGCDTAWAYITVNCPGITIFDGFSPNGNGVNETFVIQGIESFPESDLKIYNRWGNRVHQAIGYQNDWGGTWEGKDLPDGTYFYILNLMDDADNPETFSGWLEIRR